MLRDFCFYTRSRGYDILNTLLFVSNTFPAHDTNAGDWRVYTVCKELAKTNTVYFLPLAFLWEGRRYIDDLRNAGVKVVLPGERSLYDFPRLLKRLRIRTVVFEWYDTAQHFLRYFPLCEKVVIDSHELYYVKELRRSRAEGGEPRRGYLRELKGQELDVYRMADAVVAISDEEKRMLEKELPGKKVLVMPTWGETPRQERLPAFEDRRDLVFFASFFNREHADAVTYFARSVLPRVRRALPQVRLHVAGERSSALEGVFPAEGGRSPVSIDGRVADIGGYLGGFRVFVCPLRYGAGFKKKLLDAALAGCPIVTTEVGLEGFELRPGREVSVAADPAQFARSVVALYTDKQLWSGMSRGALRRVRESHPYGQGLREFEDYLRAGKERGGRTR